MELTDKNAMIYRRWMVNQESLKLAHDGNNDIVVSG